jgi:hypothetical protein
MYREITQREGFDDLGAVGFGKVSHFQHDVASLGW